MTLESEDQSHAAKIWAKKSEISSADIIDLLNKTLKFPGFLQTRKLPRVFSVTRKIYFIEFDAKKNWENFRNSIYTTNDFISSRLQVAKILIV